MLEHDMPDAATGGAEERPTIHLCHLYPDQLNMYGDRGNIITLRRRCEWRSSPSLPLRSVR